MRDRQASVAARLEYRMRHHPAEEPAAPARRRAALVLACCCAVLGACGGGDGASIAPFLFPAAAPVGPQAEGDAADRRLVGQTRVSINPQLTPPPLAADGAPPAAPGPGDPAAIVALARDAKGNVHLRQRDGRTRTLAPDGRLSLEAGTGSRETGTALPPSLIVAVDSANTVHLVDPDACVARTVAPDGRVTTTFLPAPGAGKPCAAGHADPAAR